MSDILRLLRYNTGNDKQAFIKFKNNFDAVIFNATIVAYSGPSVADLVSVHKNQYIIDPQTHIFQHDISAIQSSDKNNNIVIKKSVSKYLDKLPSTIRSILLDSRRPLSVSDINGNIDALVDSVYCFETNFVNSYIEEKEYDKYLEFAKIGPKPKMVIAPYFMLKSEYDSNEIKDWMEINHKCLENFINRNNGAHTVAAQLIMDQSVLFSNDILDIIRSTYTIAGYEYIFLWIDNFDTFETSDDLRKAFLKLLKCFNEIGLKPIMAYGGYDSIFLCNSSISNRLFGVAQSVGYGESRPITPVGGGMPTNKYYFPPIHRRLKFDDAARILSDQGYFSKEKSNAEYAKNYYTYICDCRQCHEVIKNDINNFDKYNESIPFIVKARYGDISRNRPTTSANLIAALHFLYCKVTEWDEINKIPLKDLKANLIANYEKYCPSQLDSIKKWCEIYAH
jgi:hypothetical protein